MILDDTFLQITDLTEEADCSVNGTQANSTDVNEVLEKKTQTLILA